MRVGKSTSTSVAESSSILLKDHQVYQNSLVAIYSVSGVTVFVVLLAVVVLVSVLLLARKQKRSQVAVVTRQAAVDNIYCTIEHIHI